MKNTLYDTISHKLGHIIGDWGLSDRETQIVELFLKDITSTKEISSKLGISPITVRNHLEKIYKKSGCKNKNTLIVHILQSFMRDNTNLSFFYRSPRVLIVDDEQDICDGLALTLESKGIKVTTTTEPKNVISLIKLHRYDFIICDIRMPNFDGKKLIQQIKSTHFYWPRVIMMTGYSGYYPEELYNLGAISYLKKPFNPDELFKIILENYSDEESLVENLINRPAEVDVSTLTTVQELDNTNLGIGGAFLKLSSSELLDDNISEGSYVKFSYKAPDIESEVKNVFAKVIWKRTSKRDDLEAGIGVKLLDPKFLTSQKYEKFLIENGIISFIPIGVGKL